MWTAAGVGRSCSPLPPALGCRSVWCVGGAGQAGGIAVIRWSQGEQGRSHWLHSPPLSLCSCSPSTSTLPTPPLSAPRAALSPLHPPLWAGPRPPAHPLPPTPPANPLLPTPPANPLPLTPPCLTFLQKLISLRTSMMETCWGVVTTTAPSTRASLRNCGAGRGEPPSTTPQGR